MPSIFRRVGAVLTKLFHPPAPAVVHAAPPRRRAPAQMAEGASESAFLGKLRGILAGNGGTAQAGRINVIGLDRIKAKLGDRWDELSDRVHATARSAIDKCLQPQDVWTACGNSYVIAFGSMNIDEARAKCRIIAQIIESALLGEADGQGVSVATAVATVDGQVMLRDLPALDAMLAHMPATAPAVASSAPPLPAAPPQERAAANAWTMSEQRRQRDEMMQAPGDARARREESPWPATEERLRTDSQAWPMTRERAAPNASAWPLAEERARLAPEAWPTSSVAPPPAAEASAPWKTSERLASSSWPPAEERAPDAEAWRPMGGPVGGPPIVPPPQNHAPPMPQIVMPSPPASRPVEVEAAQIEEDLKDEIVWEPVWDVRHERVPIYRAKYIKRSKMWLQSPGDDALAGTDFALRNTVLRELTGCLVDSRYIVLGLPVRYWTIANYGLRREYLSALSQRISTASRKFLLIFVTDVPNGVPGSRLIELIGALRPFCRGLVIETSLHVLDFAALGAARVFAVGADLSVCREPDHVLMLQIDHFARGATKAGVANCYLAGVESMPMVTAAIAAGFRYVSGEAVGSLGAQVSNVRQLGLDSIYRANLEAKGLHWPEKGGAA